jgi:hypothetical protein
MAVVLRNRKRIAIQISLLAPCLGLMLFFQNCSQIKPMEGVIENQSLYDGAKKLDDLYLSALKADTTLLFSRSNNINEVSELPAFSDAGSVLVAVDLPATGVIASLAGSVDSEEIRITVENNFVYAYHLTDANNYVYKSMPVPTGVTKILIAVSAGPQPENLVLLVNGQLATNELQKIGAATAFSYVYKDIVYSTTLDVLVLNRHLTAAELNVFSRYIAKKSTIAGVVFDPQVINPSQGGGETAPTPLFLAAKVVIDNNCTSCHNNNSTIGDYRNLTQAQFVQKGLVVPSDLANSKLYYRLDGAVVGPGPRNMPQGGQLSPTQIQAVSDWIGSL